MSPVLPMMPNLTFGQLQTAIERCVGSHSDAVEVEMLSWMCRTALEIIGEAGLGYSFDPLVEDVPDAFAQAIKGFQYVPVRSYQESS